MKIKTLGIFIASFTVIIIFWFSSKPSNVSMEQSNKVLIKMNLIDQYDVEAMTPKYDRLTFLIRKGAHVIIFMILGAGVAMVMEEDTVKIIMLIVLLAIFDELHQSFNGRGASLSDVFLDMGGGFTGWSIVELMKYYFKKREESQGKD